MSFGNKLAGGGGTKSDIEFIRSKILSGDWIHITGDINTLGSKLEYIVPDGKTFFVYKAKVVISDHLTISGITVNPSVVVSKSMVKANLQIDGVEKDIVNVGITATNSGFGSTEGAGAGANLVDGYFICEGLSLVGDGIKKVTIENILDAGSAKATLTGWIENT